MRSRIKHLRRDINQWSLLTVAIGFFVIVPLLSIVVYLFAGVGEMWSHIVEYFLLDYVVNSLVILLGTGVITFLFGVSSAWFVARYDFRFRKMVTWLLFLPLAIPSYIVAYAYVGLWGNGGTVIRLLQSIGIEVQKIDMMNIYGLIWILSCSLYPYVYGSCLAMFKCIPKSIQESSNLLGASNWRYFRTIALPMAMPGVIGGLFLVFMEVLNDYGAAKYYGVQTFTTGIFRTWTMLEDLQSAVYLSGILVVLVFSIKGIVWWLRGNKSYTAKGDVAAQCRLPLKGNVKWLAVLSLLIPIVFGFVLPVGQLVYWAVLTFDSMFNIELLWVAAQSFGLAIGAVVCILLTSIVLLFFSRWNKVKALRVFKQLSTIGYIIPGAIIGIGVIRSSQFVIDTCADTLGLEVGYLFYGSSFVLLYAYIFRFLAVAFSPLESNMLNVGKSMYESAYLLKSNKFRTLFKVELPMMKTAITSACLLVFIDILKELPLTLILKPYNIQTLAVKAYEYADDERVAEAALPALTLIVLIVLLMAAVSLVEKKVKNR